MNRAKWKKYSVYALVVVWMWVIFSMSHQPGEVSGDISGGISHLFMKMWNQIFRLEWTELEILGMAELWDYPIRKLAHMTEFGILAALLYWAVNEQKWPYRLSFLAAVLYAVSDEVHQLFVPGRNGNLFDVLVDSCGITIALIIIWGIQMIKNRNRKR